MRKGFVFFGVPSIDFLVFARRVRACHARRREAFERRTRVRARDAASMKRTDMFGRSGKRPVRIDIDARAALNARVA